MKKTCICEAIDCPYFSDSTKDSFGCQFYRNSKNCHLHKGALSAQDTTLSTDYEIIVVNASIDLALLKNENDAYLRETNRYARHREFMELYPDLPSVDLPSRVL